MSAKRKWILVSIVGTAAILVFGAIGGIAYAQTGASTATPTPPPNPQMVLADKVAAILKLDNATVENAFKQAQAEIQTERGAAQLKQQEAQIDQMVTDGKMTTAQAAQIKTWLESKPKVSIPGLDMFGGPGGGPGGPGGGPGGRGGPGGPGGPGGHPGGPGKMAPPAAAP